MRRMNDPIPPPLPGPQKSKEFVYLICALARLGEGFTVTEDDYKRAMNTPYKLTETPEYGGKSTVVSVQVMPRPSFEDLGQEVAP